MGFPLHQGSVSNCILTCHWHHARFDLESGGTFDPWADDARSFPLQIRSGEVWLDPTDYLDTKTHPIMKRFVLDLTLLIFESLKLIPLHCSCHSALVISFSRSFALIMEFLTFAQTDRDFYPTFFKIHF